MRRPASRVGVAVALAVALASAAVALVSRRVINEGEAEILASDAAFHGGDLRGAVLHARRAAALYVPGADHVQAGYDRLQAVAVGSEAKGEAEIAALAWRGVRGAALESRHVAHVATVELDRANESLARLAASGARERHSDERDRARAMLDRDDAPEAVWVGALLLGLALIGIGLAAFATRGIDASGSVRGRGTALYAMIAAAGASLWTLAAWVA